MLDVLGAVTVLSATTELRVQAIDVLSGDPAHRDRPRVGLMCFSIFPM
jgi:hypothetical protein